MSSVSKALALPTQWLRKWPINSRQVFAAVAYQVRGPRELVKRPITVLVQVVRIGPALADAGIGTIEEEQPVHPVRLCLGEGAGDVGPDAVTDDLAPSQPEPVGKGFKSSTMTSRPCLSAARRSGLSVSPKLRRLRMTTLKCSARGRMFAHQVHQNSATRAVAPAACQGRGGRNGSQSSWRRCNGGSSPAR